MNYFLELDFPLINDRFDFVHSIFQTQPQNSVYTNYLLFFCLLQLLLQFAPISTSKPHPPPSHLTTDDPLEQTMDLLYHGISHQSISRPRATPQQLDARRLEKLHKQ